MFKENICVRHPKPLLHHGIFMRPECCLQIIYNIVLLTSDSSEMKVCVLSHPWPFSFLISLWIKAHSCRRDPISSEPALQVSTLEVKSALYLVVYEVVTNCVEMCLPLLPYSSTTIFTFFLVDQVPTSLSLVGPIPAFMCHAPLFKKIQRELFFPKLLVLQNLSLSVILKGVH